MITAPLLLPRSRTHAYTQLICCLLLFYIYPSLIPDWYCFPLTVLLVGLISASSVPRGYSLPLSLTPGSVRAAPLSKITGDFTPWFYYVFKAADSWVRLAIGLFWRVARGCGLVCWEYAVKVRTWAVSMFEKAFGYTPVILRHISQITCQVYAFCANIYRALHKQFQLSLSNLQKPSLPPLNLHSTRYILATLLTVLYVPFAFIARQKQRLVWLLITLLHFLSFTLGLTIIFLLLCIYGFTVVFMHQVVTDGVAAFVAGLLQNICFW